MVQARALPRPRKQEFRKPRDREWSLLSAQGKVLFFIALCPGATTNEIALALDLTPRAVWNNVRTMRRAGTVRARSCGRTNKLYVNLDAPLFSPAVRGLTLRPLMGKIVKEARRRPNEICVRTRGRLKMSPRSA
jgi:hypothetical protein